MATSTLGSGTLVLAGTTSGTTTVTATAVAGTTTLTLPAATDTLVGKATTDTLTNKTLTGAVMNGTLGATTPSTVAATTLTTSSTVTHNGGTANGVPYLDGSKVLTTGSALTFDGTVLTVGTSTGLPLTGSKLSIANDANSALRLGISNQNAGASSLVGIAFEPAGGSWKIDVPADTSGFVPPMYFKAGASTNVTFAYGGNVGIGTSSPAVKLDVAGNATIQNGVLTIGKDTVYDAFINTPESMYFNVDSDGNSTGNRFVWGTDRAGTTGGTEWMRLDSSGNLLVGTTSAIVGGKLSLAFDGSAVNGIVLKTTYASTGSDYMQFYNSALGLAGRITQNGTLTVNYNTASDYRLKNTVEPMTGALAKVAALKPCTYKWNVDGSAGEGFIAHELAEVCPHAVSGDKDAVDADGNPKYQGIDVSHLVATLTAAIQELKAEFDAYKALHP